jgi:hypothetical protein
VFDRIAETVGTGSRVPLLKPGKRVVPLERVKTGTSTQLVVQLEKTCKFKI